MARETRAAGEEQVRATAAQSEQQTQSEQQIETERDEGILHVDAPKRYASSEWKSHALLRYLLTGRRPPPIPSWTGVVEPAEAGKIGIACSGGGIRSAAFSLGALQELQRRRHRVLQRARYLAGVSGGSYIAAAFNMVRKTWEGEQKPVNGQRGWDDSDPGKVTRAHPPFFPGSPEEQYLRNRSSYIAPGALGKLQLVYRVLLGMGLNMLFIAFGVIAISAPLSLLYGAIYPPLLAHLERGGLCRAPSHGAGVGAPGQLVTCAFTPLSIPQGLWIAIAAGAGFAIVLGAASILAYRWPVTLADVTETWSLRLLTIFGLLALLLIALPLLLSVVRGWGAATTRVAAHPGGAPTHGKGAGGAGAPAGAVAGAGGALALGGAGLLQLRAQLTEAKRVADEAAKAKKWLAGLTPRLRTALAYLIAATIGPALLLAVALWTMTIALNLAETWQRALIAAGLPVAFLLVYMLVDMTTWSLHPFYRRRLCSAFALKRVGDDGEPAIASDRSGRASTEAGVAVERDYSSQLLLSEMAVRARPDEEGWPTLLVCAAANISDSAATPPGRAVTSFTFSPTAMGGPLVGAVKTKKLEKAVDRTRQRYFTLPAAVAVSGAAISPSMGKMTRWPLRFLMTLANVRLGVWVPNPRRLETFKKAQKLYPRPRASYLVRELLGVNSINARYLYVTDGGHYENLGLVELLRRGCTEIYCFDASNDDFGALGDAVSLARSELDVQVDVDYSALKVDPKANRAKTSCVTATITYPEEGAPQGTLYYVRLVMPPKAPADAVAYQTRDSRFPHDPTVDQLYTDQRFEAYRGLGALAANAALAANTALAERSEPTRGDGRGSSLEVAVRWAPPPDEQT